MVKLEINLDLPCGNPKMVVEMADEMPFDRFL